MVGFAQTGQVDVWKKERVLSGDRRLEAVFGELKIIRGEGERLG